jgi:6-phosphogluconolactonase (cycloisomerase 2 family)
VWVLTALLLGALALGGAAGRADAVVDPVMVTPLGQTPTGEGPNSVAFSPNGELLAASNIDPHGNDVSIFKVSEATGVLTAVAQTGSNANSQAPYSVAFSPAGSLLATSNYEAGTVSVFKVNESTGALTPVAQTGSNAETGPAPVGIAFSPDGTLLAVGSAAASGPVSIFKVDDATGALTPVGKTSAPYPEEVTFSPDGNLLAATGQQGGTGSLGEGGTGLVSLFKVEESTGVLTPVTQTPASIAYTPEYAQSVDFSPNGNLLAVSDWLSDLVSVFTVEESTGDVTPVTQSPASNAQTEGYPYDAVFSPLGGLLAVSNQDSGTISLYEVNETTGALTPDPQSPASNAQAGASPVSLAFSPHGALIATANFDSSTVSMFTVSGSTATETGTGTGTGGTSGSGSTGTAGAGGGSAPTSTGTSGAGLSAPPIASLSTQLGLPSTKACVSQRKLTIHVAEHVVQSTGANEIKSAEVLLAGRVVAKLKGPVLVAHVSLAGLKKGSFKITVKATTTAGKTLTASSTFHTCRSAKHKRK